MRTVACSFDVEPGSERELALDRVLQAPRAAVWRCWTEPELVVRWFTPPPFRTVHAELDLRPGGGSLVVMQGPDGVEHPNRGVYLEVEPGRRLVFTDAYVQAWEPSAKPFMTVTLDFDDAGGGATRYFARALHWTVEDCETHAAMGFHRGWGIAADQLEAVAAELG